MVLMDVRCQKLDNRTGKRGGQEKHFHPTFTF